VEKLSNQGLLACVNCSTFSTRARRKGRENFILISLKLRNTIRSKQLSKMCTIWISISTLQFARAPALPLSLSWSKTNPYCLLELRNSSRTSRISCYEQGRLQGYVIYMAHQIDIILKVSQYILCVTNVAF
jgi:hypothetical protein